MAPAPKKFQSYNPNFKTDEEKKEEVRSKTCCVFLRVAGLNRDPLPVRSSLFFFIAGVSREQMYVLTMGGADFSCVETSPSILWCV